MDFLCFGKYHVKLTKSLLNLFYFCVKAYYNKLYYARNKVTIIYNKPLYK